MKTLKFEVGLSSILVLTLMSCSTGTVERTTASVHTVTTPYADLTSRLEIKPGQTYLSFMKTQVKPALDAFDPILRAEAKAKPNQYSDWQTDLINGNPDTQVPKGTGVAVRIDEKNYFFNVGYNNGSQTGDVQSGRSYGVGPTNRESDPSDQFYLNELEAYLKAEPNSVSDFYSALMKALTNCDTSSWTKLSTAGQMVATDFMAIYTAESDRHLMVKLSPKQHPWEIDLAATTFVSVFDVTTGKINQETDKTTGKGMQTFQLDLGSIELWYGKGTKGSGIGETRGARTDLTKKISSYEEKNHPELIEKIANITKMNAGTDMIQDVFEYLNNNASPLVMTASESQQLSDAVVDFLVQVQKDSSAIADEIAKN
jgi:hypothetical protein